MPRIDTEVQINASAAEVWRELTDMDSYADWNSFIKYNSGEPQLGEKLNLKLSPPSGMSFTIKPTVTARVENQKFEWLGSLLMRGIFDGRHTFEIKEENGTSTLHHYETFGGILTFPMGWLGIYKKTKPGFELMNQELKKRVEERVAASGS